ncbi:hypothetical protein KY318_03825, partial [Candidatus Woesearchaeota archaeon]|nr:hypothetical protein [Candidatus Woesearchaeota archaeon]
VCTPEIGTMVLWAPLTARLPKHTWRSRFTPEQLRELKEKGYITKTRDKGVRKRYIIDAQILRDMESVNQRELLSKLKCPVLIIHGSKDDAVSIEDSKNALKYLPQGSKLEVILGGEHKLSNHLDRVISLSLNWFRRYLSGSCVQQRE